MSPIKATENKKPTSAFLSDEDIEAVGRDSAANDSYVALSKLDEGKPFRYRFLGPAISGYSTWVETDGKSKPVRWAKKPESDEIPGNLQINKSSGKPADIKRFIAGFVWDYAKERVSIMMIDQKTILQEIHAAIVDPDYGDPQAYDIKITRKVEKNFTKYKLAPAPQKDLEKHIAAAWEEIKDTVDLRVLFENGNPFDPEAVDGEDAAPDEEDMD